MSVPHDWIPTVPTPAAPPREHVLAGLRGTDEGAPISSSCSRPRASGSRARRSTPTSRTSTPRACRASTATWCWSAARTGRRPRCSARASSASGCRCWARRPRRSAPAARCAPATWPSPPTASTASPGAAASTRPSCSGIFRGTDHGGWDPDGHRLPPLHDRHRQPVPQRHRLRDGPEVRGPGSATARTRRPPCASSATAPPARATCTRASSGPPSTTRRSSSTARTTSGRSPSRTSAQTRVPLYRRAQGYGFPGIRVDGNDVLACLAVSRWALEECRSGNGPVLVEAFTYRMDAHTTSDDPTRYRLADELELWKLKDPLERVRVHLVRGARGRAATSSTRSRPTPTRWPRACAQHCLAMPQPGPERIFSARLRGAVAGARRRSATRTSPTTRRSRVVRDMTTLTMAKALNDGLRAAMEDDPKVARDGRGRRPARRRVPGHRRPAEGLRRAARPRHPAGRVGHHRHRRRAGDARVPPGVRDPVRRVRLPGYRPDRPRSWRSCTTARRGGCGCRWSCGSRSAAGSARSSTTASRRSRCSRTSPG